MFEGIYWTESDITRIVGEIEEIKGDNEVAHSRQDDLIKSVLIDIANSTQLNHDETIEMIKALVSVYDIEFERWMA